jgi:hypothetical protein
MKTKVLITLFGSLVILVVVAVGLVAAKPDNPGQGKKPDKQKPVHATDVELVKKITIRGRPPWAGGGKPKKEGAATGILGEPVSGSRHAVVVGISDYPGTENDLNYSDEDADEMAEALSSSTVYGFSDVTLLQDGAATRAAILGAIDGIATDAGEIVFFFSGHGARGIADDGDKERLDEAIVAHNGEDLVPIWDGELQGAFSEFTTSRIVFIFDTCLAGGMERDLGEPGRIIAMATSERGYAYESDAWQNGEFSYYFVDLGTLQGKANVHDYDGDTILEVPEQVTVEEAFDYAKTNCQSDKPTIGDEFEDDLLP